MIKNIFEIGVGGVISILLGLFTTPIITRIIDPLQYGQFTIINSYVGIIVSVAFIGLNETLLRFFFEFKEDKDKAKLIRFCFVLPELVAIALSFGLFILLKLNIIKATLTFQQIVFLVVLVVLTIWNKTSLLLLQNTFKSKIYSLCTVLQSALYSVGTISLILIFKGETLSSLLIASTLSVFIPALIGTAFTRNLWNLSNLELPNRLNEIIKYAAPSFVYVSLYSIYETLDKLIIDSLCGEYEVGIYASISALVAVFTIVQTAFSVIWQPQQTKKYIDEDNDKEFISQGNRYMTIIMFFVGINMIFFKDIICYILGEKYREGIQLLPLLLFNPIINTLLVTVTSGIEKKKKNIYRAFIIILVMLSMVVLSKLFYPALGTKGIVLGFSISMLLEYFLTAFISIKLYYIDYALNKFGLIALSLFGFALYNTYFYFNILTIILYFLFLLVFYFVYKKTILEIIDIIKTSFIR